MAKSENGAARLVSHSASAAAIFIGCCSVISLRLDVAGDGDGRRPTISDDRPEPSFSDGAERRSTSLCGGAGATR